MPGLRLAIFTAMAVLIVIAARSNAALAHSDPCHLSHTCPSDHHSYPWQGLWCTSYQDERLPTDTKKVVVGGRTYWCHRTGQTSGSPSTATTSGSACGVERWTVKTLQDRPTLLPLLRTTVSYLVSRPAPARLPDSRLPFERHLFQVTASVILLRHEADSDIHLVLQDQAGQQMIAEAPLPSCAPNATPLRRMQMGLARAAVRLCTRATVTGVAFFDFQHGQTGVAPNAIELHPILGFRCLG
jgi:hypothetical protein